MLNYIEGVEIRLNIDHIKKHVGKRVAYIRSLDIDKSGRGYFFPRSGVIDSTHGTQVEIDGNFYMLSTFVEMALLPEPPENNGN